MTIEVRGKPEVAAIEQVKPVILPTTKTNKSTNSEDAVNSTEFDVVINKRSSSKNLSAKKTRSGRTVQFKKNDIYRYY